MKLIKQSSAVEPLEFFMYDSSNHVTGKTGLSPTVVIRKNGGSFATPAGSVTEIGNGFYQVAPNGTDSNTLGGLLLSATASGADQATQGYQIVAFNPLSSVNLGLSAIPATDPGASGGILISGTNSNFAVSADFLIGGSFQIGGAMTVTGGIISDIIGTLSTLTTYTGNTPQTGDAFARIGATGSGLTSLAPSATALSTATWTGALATALGVTNTQMLLVPRRSGGTFIYTNVNTSETASVAIT